MANFDKCVNILLILDKCQKNYCRAAQIFAARHNIRKSHMALLQLEQRYNGSLNSK